MARREKVIEPLGTIWEVNDMLWDKVEQFWPNSTRRPTSVPACIDQRKALNGVIYRMRSGCQWNHLPKIFGDDSSIHRTFQRWVKRGVIARLWCCSSKPATS